MAVGALVGPGISQRCPQADRRLIHKDVMDGSGYVG